MAHDSRWIARTVLALVSTLVGILIAEQLVRLFAPQPLIRLRPDIWMPVDGLGYQKAPHVDAIINTGERAVRLMTDERGHRVGLRGRPRGERKILAVGDSFLEALQVDYPGLVTTRLAEILARHESLRESGEAAMPQFDVINAGVSGWGPGHYYRKVSDELSADEYELVLLFVFVGNDVVRHTRTWHAARREHGVPVRMPSRLGYREIVEAWIYPTYAQLRARSHLIVLLKRRLLNAFMRLGR